MWPQTDKTVLLVNRMTKQHLSFTLQPVCSPFPTLQCLWLIKEVGKDQFLIMHIQSCSYLSYVSVGQCLQLKLQRQKDRRHQTWSILLAQSNGNEGVVFCWLRPCGESVSLHGSSYSELLRLSAMDATLNICQWEIREGGFLLQRSCIVRSPQSQLVLSVVEGRVTQQEKAGGGNERWILQMNPSNEGVRWIIRNLSTKEVLTSLKNKATVSVGGLREEQYWQLDREENKCTIRDHFGHFLDSAGKEGTPTTLTPTRLQWVLETST